MHSIGSVKYKLYFLNTDILAMVGGTSWIFKTFKTFLSGEQRFCLGPTLYFMTKNGETFMFKMNTRPYKKI